MHILLVSLLRRPSQPKLEVLYSLNFDMYTHNPLFITQIRLVSKNNVLKTFSEILFPSPKRSCNFYLNTPKCDLIHITNFRLNFAIFHLGHFSFITWIYIYTDMILDFFNYSQFSKIHWPNDHLSLRMMKSMILRKVSCQELYGYFSPNSVRGVGVGVLL